MKPIWHPSITTSLRALKSIYSPELWGPDPSFACVFPPLGPGEALWLQFPSVGVQPGDCPTHLHSDATHHTPVQPHRVSATPEYNITQTHT